MAVQATLIDSTPLLSNVVKGRRNGGSSNNISPRSRFSWSCERPPKWRFKQRRLRVVNALPDVVKGRRNGGSSNAKGRAAARPSRCERPPKWRDNHRLCCPIQVKERQLPLLQPEAAADMLARREKQSFHFARWRMCRRSRWAMRPAQICHLTAFSL